MSKIFIRFIILSIFISFGTSSCNKKEDYTPKPRGYYRISFPKKSFTKLEGIYPYSFDYPQYANIESEISSQQSRYWINIEIPANKAAIHISYKKVDKNNLGKLTEESRDLAYKHAIKAEAIEEKIFVNPINKVYGTLYSIKGNAASPMQFYLTDSIENFLRGSLYIKEVPNIDSLQPVINFLEQDIIRLVETLEWKDIEK